MSIIVSLCEYNRRMLTSFSNRCVERLTGRAVVTLPASFTSEHLRDNVEKEAAKDCLVIERAAKAFESGTRLGDGAIDDLFERSKEIDRIFIDRLTMPSFTFEPQYEVIGEIRKKRYHYLADLTADVLEAGAAGQGFAESIHRLYTADQFHGLIGEILFLYCIEVKKLAGMVRFLPPFNRAMDGFTDEVVEAMELARHEIAADLAANLFPQPEHQSTRRSFLPFSPL